MKISTRRWLGAAFVGVAFLGTCGVFLSHAWPVSLEESQKLSSGSTVVTGAVYELHLPLWLRVLLLATAGLGVILLLIPGRKKVNI